MIMVVNNGGLFRVLVWKSSQNVPLAIICRYSGGNCITTGFAEGDCLSIIAMLSIAILFFYRMTQRGVIPVVYADNWSWLCGTFRQQWKAWQDTLNLVQSLKMKISLKKSWVWASSKQLREQMKLLNLLFPDGTCVFDIKESARDLGELVQYSRKQVIQPLAERIQAGIKRLQRLAWVPITLQQKAKIIQTGIWPFALYAVDTHYTGKSHFEKLRAAVVQALVGFKTRANPYLACLVLSTFMQDPLVYVLTNFCRVIRRLVVVQPDLARQIISLACAFEGQIAFGPASALRKYFNIMKAEIKPDGDIWYDGKRCFNVFRDHGKFFAREITWMWEKHLMKFLVQRKGLYQLPYDFGLTKKTYMSLNPPDQKIFALNLIGGFQSNATKAMWADDTTEACILCGQKDHREHQMFECSHLQNIRNQHVEAVQLLQNKYPSWIYHPIPQQPQQVSALKFAVSSFEHIPPSFEGQQSQSVHTYFTDGACKYPEHVSLRYSAWAVIRDVTNGSPECLEQILQVVTMILLPSHCSVQFWDLLLLVKPLTVLSLSLHTKLSPMPTRTLNVVK